MDAALPLPSSLIAVDGVVDDALTEAELEELQCRLDDDATLALAYLATRADEWLEPGDPLPQLVPAPPTTSRRS